jgi:hypothetical protein
MKLQAELAFVIAEFEKRKSEIKEYAEKLKNSGGYKDYETRLAWDILRGVLGSEWICNLYNKYDCNDSHIDTLAKKALKAIL